METGSILYYLMLILIALVMPVMGVINGNKITSTLVKDPHLKLSVYRQTIITLWLITIMILTTMYLNNDGLDLVGAGFVFDIWSVFTLMGVCLIGLVIVNLIRPGKKVIAWLGKSYERVLYLIPRSKSEYQWSIMVSFTAGFCEEIIYRGFLFEQLNIYLGELGALVLANLVFAMCHWGTGYKNALWSLGLGLVWSLSYIQTGSLWFAICTHILVDIISMTLGRQTLLKQPAVNPI